MLTLQFGQCGNQLGYELYTKIAQDIESRSCGVSFADSYEYEEYSSTRWFERSSSSSESKRFARAILIDTERKVIDEIIKETKNQWHFRRENIITPGCHGGSANNWSLGYSKKGQECQEYILEAVRQELERIDKVDGFFCLMGCAGGTGSGVGSFIIQSLRHEYSTKNILAALVFPFDSGEIATQNYNATLSVAKIIDVTDLIIVLENQRLHEESLGQMSEKTQSNQHGDFPRNINEIAAQKIVSLLQPARNIVDNSENNVSNLIKQIIPHPAYKLTTIESFPLHLNIKKNTSTPRSYTSQSSVWDSSTWQTHCKYLIQRILSTKDYSSHCYAEKATASNHRRAARSLTNILITRGTNEFNSEMKSHKNSNNTTNNINNQLNRDIIYTETDWLPSSDRFTHYHHNRRMFDNEKLASIITNSSRIHKPLDDIMSKAWSSYTHSAFLHQYKKYGLDDDDFLRAFAKIENLISSYKQLEK